MILTDKQYEELLSCNYPEWPERAQVFGSCCPCKSCCVLSEENRAFRNYIAIKQGWKYNPLWVAEIKNPELRNYLINAILLRTVK